MDQDVVAASSAPARNPIRSGAEYIESLRGRRLKVYLMGEAVEEPVDHPIIRPSINAVAKTYDLANEDPELASAVSPLTGGRVNRFLHISASPGDLVMQNKMQRRLGQLTGTCFQRCVGMDALNSLHSVTYDLDEKYRTDYHVRFKQFLARVQSANLVIGGAMTDVKGDRGRSPSQQADPDLFLHVVRHTPEGVYVSGAKAHQTGCLNSYWLIVMPTMRLEEADKDYAIVGAIPVDAEGITYIYGRQSCDTRNAEEGDIDAGNAQFSGQEAMIVFEEVFIPRELVFLDGEFEFASTLVERFTCYHRRSYVCKHHVTRFPYEIGRLAQDIAGGLMVTLPSERDLRHETIGPLIEKYLKGRPEVSTEDRIRILRLVENMTLGRNAVGYLTESMHGAGSPQAQRIQIARSMQIEFKKELAKALAGVADASSEQISDDVSTYMARVFAPVSN